eukprot:scaffold23848_cov42-Phaeocystis_antarctica.AAC.2
MRRSQKAPARVTISAPAPMARQRAAKRPHARSAERISPRRTMRPRRTRCSSSVRRTASRRHTRTARTSTRSAWPASPFPASARNARCWRSRARQSPSTRWSAPRVACVQPTAVVLPQTLRRAAARKHAFHPVHSRRRAMRERFSGLGAAPSTALQPTSGATSTSSAAAAAGCSPSTLPESTFCRRRHSLACACHACRTPAAVKRSTRYRTAARSVIPSARVPHRRNCLRRWCCAAAAQLRLPSARSLRATAAHAAHVTKPAWRSAWRRCVAPRARPCRPRMCHTTPATSRPHVLPRHARSPRSPTPSKRADSRTTAAQCTSHTRRRAYCVALVRRVVAIARPCRRVAAAAHQPAQPRRSLKVCEWSAARRRSRRAAYTASARVHSAPKPRRLAASLSCATATRSSSRIPMSSRPTRSIPCSAAYAGCRSRAFWNRCLAVTTCHHAQPRPSAVARSPSHERTTAFQPRTCVLNAAKPQALARGDGGTKAPGDLCGVSAPLECAQSCPGRPGCRAMALPRGHFQHAVARAPRRPRAVSRARCAAQA